MNYYRFTKETSNAAAAELEKTGTAEAVLAAGGKPDITVSLSLGGAETLKAACTREYSGYPDAVQNCVPPEQFHLVTDEKLEKICKALEGEDLDIPGISKYESISHISGKEYAEAAEQLLQTICDRINEKEQLIDRIIEAALHDE